MKGVVVHSGTADYGHYYSYIRTTDDKWKEFNDSNIREFNSKELEKECFGGLSGADDFSYGKAEYSKNAYMLVYERVEKKPIEF